MTTENLNKDQTMFADGFEDAIIGIHMGDVPRVVYDKAKMQSILMRDDDMTEEDAIDYLEYNVWHTYVGEGIPIYIDRCTYEEVIDFIESNT